MNPAEQIILQSLKNGDRTIYKELFDKYSTSLFYYACKFINQDAARDIVQDVFLSVWMQREKLSITSALNSYLFGITRNKCLKYIEKHKRSAPTSDQQLVISEVKYYDNNSETINSLIEKELMEQYEEALAKLPPKCLEVFLLSRKEGLKNREIAAQLSISEKAVEKHISKALKLLRDNLKDYLPLIAYLGKFYI